MLEPYKQKYIKTSDTINLKLFENLEILSVFKSSEYILYDSIWNRTHGCLTGVDYDDIKYGIYFML